MIKMHGRTIPSTGPPLAAFRPLAPAGEVKRSAAVKTKFS
jgi:hypothetical protein